MHLNMGDRGFDGRNLDLLMKTWFGILAVQGGLAVGALFRNHLTDIFGGKDLLLEPFMARLTAGLFFWIGSCQASSWLCEEDPRKAALNCCWSFAEVASPI